MTTSVRPQGSRGLGIIRAIGYKFFRDNGFSLASGLAFNLLLYFIPLFLLMVSLLGYTVVDSDRAMHEVQAVLLAFLPHSQKALAENVATIVANRGSLGVAGFASFLLFSTFLFGSVRTVLNCVFEVRQERSLVHGVWIDFLMMGATAVLLLLAVGVGWFLTVAETFAQQFSAWRSLVQPGFEFVGRMIGTSAIACVFYILYRFAPAQTISSWGVLIASVAGTVLFLLAKWGFGWYVHIAQQNVEFYGALAGLIFLMMWLYYVSVVFIIGAEIGWVYDRERSKTTPIESRA